MTDEAHRPDVIGGEGGGEVGDHAVEQSGRKVGAGIVTAEAVDLDEVDAVAAGGSAAAAVRGWGRMQAATPIRARRTGMVRIMAGLPWRGW